MKPALTRNVTFLNPPTVRDFERNTGIRGVPQPDDRKNTWCKELTRTMFLSLMNRWRMLREIIHQWHGGFFLLSLPRDLSSGCDWMEHCIEYRVWDSLFFAVI